MVTSTTVVQRFITSVTRYPTRPALWAKGQLYSYDEISRMSESIRQRLDQIDGCGASCVGLMTADGAETYAAMMAILANGSTYVPINSKNPAARNLEIIRDSGITALLHESTVDLDPMLVSGLPEWCRLLSIPHLDESLPLTLASITENCSSDVAYLLFTSGSTGKPKGVPVTHGNLNQFLSIMIDRGDYDFQQSDKFLQMFELTFDMSIASVMLPWSLGACCYALPNSRFGAATVIRMMEDHELTVTIMVPSMLVFLERFLEGRVHLPALRRAFFAGEALLDNLVQKLQKAAPNCCIENMYGPTETTITCFRYPWQQQQSPPQAVNGVVPIGRPFPGTTATLLTGNGSIIAKPGVQGELVLGGLQVFPGYWKDPDKTASAFAQIEIDGAVTNGYRTGDVCSLNSDGDFVFHGRLDAQVQIDGYRVEIGEIEHHVREILQFTHIAVVAYPVNNRLTLVLFLEAPDMPQDTMLNALRERVPGYMLPKEIRYIEALPFNQNGKIDRPKLRSLLSAEAHA